jgi:hypothetical protein
MMPPPENKAAKPPETKRPTVASKPRPRDPRRARGPAAVVNLGNEPPVAAVATPDDTNPNTARSRANG